MTNQSNEKSKNGKRLALILLALLLIAAIAFGALYILQVCNPNGWHWQRNCVPNGVYTVTIGDTQTHTDDFWFLKKLF